VEGLGVRGELKLAVVAFEPRRHGGTREHKDEPPCPDLSGVAFPFRFAVAVPAVVGCL
jgi:hypothetical protein